MILTKDELIKALQHEIHLLLHLASKIDPAKLDYRPTPKQRSTLELLQYMTIVGPIHARLAIAGSFDRGAFGAEWNREEAIVKAMNLDEVKAAIAAQPALFSQLLNPCSDAFLREEIELFGSKASRGSWLVSLVLGHLTAYRMQLFLYLKASGREELNTMNLWAGIDAPM